MVSTGGYIAENLFCTKLKKDIFEDVNKFDLKGNFDQMSNLIKTRNKK
jgi:hypothetical protein